jgi:hypothetical protein
MDRTPIIKAIQSCNGWRNGYAHSEQKGAHDTPTRVSVLRPLI